MKKKLLSFMLTLAMLLTMLPVSLLPVFAGEPADVEWKGAMNINNYNNNVIVNNSLTPTDSLYTQESWASKVNPGSSGSAQVGQIVIVGDYIYSAYNVNGKSNIIKIEKRTGNIIGEPLQLDGKASYTFEYLVSDDEGKYLFVGLGDCIHVIDLSSFTDAYKYDLPTTPVKVSLGNFRTIQYHNGYVCINGNFFKFTTSGGLKLEYQDKKIESVISPDGIDLSSMIDWSSCAFVPNATGTDIAYISAIYKTGTNKDHPNPCYYAIYALDYKNNIIIDTYITRAAWELNDNWNASGQTVYYENYLYWTCRVNNYLNAIKLNSNGTFDKTSYTISDALGYGGTVCAPVIYNDRAYVTGQSNGIMSVVNVDSSSPNFMKLIYNTTTDIFKVQSNPILTCKDEQVYVYIQSYVAPGYLFMLNDSSSKTSGDVICLATPSGCIAKPLSGFSGGGAFSMAQLACDKDGKIYLMNDDGYLYCYEATETEVPKITSDLSNSTIKLKKDDNKSISISAGAITDGGTLSYQWLKFTNNAWENIDGANDYVYTLDTSAVGITKYRCKVINTNSEKSAYIYSKWIEVEVKESLSTNTDLIIMNNGNNSNAKNGTHIAYVESNGAFNLGEYYLKDYIWFGTADQFATISNVTKEQGSAALSKVTSNNTYNSITYAYRLYKGSVSSDDDCKYTVTVTAEDGTSKDYTVSISFKMSAPQKQYAYVTIPNAGELVKDKNGAYVAQKKVQLIDRNGDGKTDIDELLYVAHEELYSGGALAGYSSYQGQYGLSLGTLWGNSSGSFGYYLNNNSCNSLADTVSANSQLTAFIYKDPAWSDQYSYFDKSTVEADVNSDVVLNLQACGYDASWNPVTSTYSSANVKVLGDNNTSIKPLKTDKDGNVKLKFNKAGEYTVVAYIDSGLIVPAVCTIKVTGTQSQGDPTPTQDPKVYFTLKGDTVHTGTLHQGTSYPTWISRKSVDYTADMTVGNLFKTVLDSSSVTYNESELENGYIATLKYNGTTLSEFTNGLNSGWMYTVNGVYPNVGLNDYALEAGDEVIWMYVDDYTAIPESRYSDYSGVSTSTKKEEKTTEPAITFTDVVKGSYYEEAVNWAVENKITNGVSETEFGPEQKTSRAQLVTFLWRLAGSPKAKVASKFSDVVSGSYYADAVAWAVENGITDGIGNNLFDPEADVDRSQVVTFLWRYKNSPKAAGSKKFDDITDVNAWYYEAVGWASEQGITDGVGNNKFNPSGDAVRAQAVTFLYRLSKLK